MADVVLQPNRGIQVQVVGGLVQQQDLRVHQDQTARLIRFSLPERSAKFFVPEGPLNAQTGADFLQAGLDLRAAPRLIGRLQPVIPGQQVLVPLPSWSEIWWSSVSMASGHQRLCAAHPPRIPGGIDGIWRSAPPFARKDHSPRRLPPDLVRIRKRWSFPPRSAQDAHPLAGVHLKGEPASTAGPPQFFFRSRTAMSIMNLFLVFGPHQPHSPSFFHWECRCPKYDR